VADDEITWREDGAGRLEIENAGKVLMKADPVGRTLHFFSLFEKRFVPVDPERAEKVLTIMDFFLRRPLAPGDEIALDYPLRDKTYHIEAGAVSRGAFRLPTRPDDALPCVRIQGCITGWGDDKRTTIDAFVGKEGDLTGKILKITFKFTDWPGVTLTLCNPDI
jgi:hypothetical protein